MTATVTRITLVDGNGHPAPADCRPIELCRIETAVSIRVLFKQSKHHGAQWERKVLR